MVILVRYLLLDTNPIPGWCAEKTLGHHGWILVKGQTPSSLAGRTSGLPWRELLPHAVAFPPRMRMVH